MKVLIDCTEGNYYSGRSEFDSPEVGNEILIDAAKTYARVGDFLHVQIREADEFDLYADPL